MRQRIQNTVTAPAYMNLRPPVRWNKWQCVNVVRANARDIDYNWIATVGRTHDLAMTKEDCHATNVARNDKWRVRE